MCGLNNAREDKPVRTPPIFSWFICDFWVLGAQLLKWHTSHFSETYLELVWKLSNMSDTIYQALNDIRPGTFACLSTTSAWFCNRLQLLVGWGMPNCWEIGFEIAMAQPAGFSWSPDKLREQHLRTWHLEVKDKTTTHCRCYSSKDIDTFSLMTRKRTCLYLLWCVLISM